MPSRQAILKTLRLQLKHEALMVAYWQEQTVQTIRARKERIHGPKVALPPYFKEELRRHRVNVRVYKLLIRKVKRAQT